MSQCPAGNDAMRQIGNYIEKNPASFKVVCHYITTFREFGIDSPHGPGEIKEDIHQLLIQKYYPRKFWEYQNLYRQGKGFEEASKEIGINSSELMGHKEEGLALLEEDFNLAEELGVKSSPTFLWENQILLIAMEKFQQFMLEERAETKKGHQYPSREPRRDESRTVTPDPTVGPTDVIPITVLYTPRCPHCRWLIDEYIPELEQEFGERIAFEYFDISIQENFEKKLMLEQEFGVVSGAVPQVFVAGRALMGRQEIEDELKSVFEEIVRLQYSSSPSTSLGIKFVEKPRQGSTILIERFKSFTPIAIAGAGLLDGINPCAFSTIVFFLSFLVFAGFNFRQMALVAISFIIAVFLTYLGLGMGCFVGIQRLRLSTLFSRYFDTVVGGLAIVLGIGSLYDYLSFKRTGETKDMLLKLPRSIKNTIHRSIRIIKDKGTKGMLRLLFIAFTVGVLVSLLESICTGQIYLPTLTFILKMKVIRWRAFLFLILYNAMFILPLIIVTLCTLYGVSSERWAKLVQHSLGKVKLTTALFFFSKGVGG